MLGDSLEEGLTYDVVQTLHENMVQQLADRKKDAAPLQISRKEIASLLNSCDVDRAQQEKFDDLYLEQFGAVGMEAALIADQKKYEIAAENVTVSVAPDRSDLVTMTDFANTAFARSAVSTSLRALRRSSYAFTSNSTAERSRRRRTASLPPARRIERTKE